MRRLTYIHKTLGVILLFSIILAAAGCGRPVEDRALEQPADTQVSVPDMNLGGGDKRIFVATDLHYLAPELHDEGSVWQKLLVGGDGRQLPYVEELTEALVSEIVREKPDVMILSGDLTHNGERASHEELAAKLARAEEAAGTQILVIPGNHDINNPWARSFLGDELTPVETISAAEFASIYSRFGPGEALLRDAGSLSYVAAVSDDLWVLMLDSVRYDRNLEFGKPVTPGRLSKETRTWIGEVGRLAREKGVRLISSMHHNLYNHNYLHHAGYTISVNHEAERVFREAEIPLVLTGHIHVQDIKKSQGTDRPVYDIASGSYLVSPHQYGILDFSPTEGLNYRTQEVDVGAWLAETLAADPSSPYGKDANLARFPDYAAEYFAAAGSARARRGLDGIDSLTAAEKDLLIETMGRMNVYYFAGRMDEVREEMLASEGYRLWTATPELEERSEYIRSMAYDYKISQTRLKITWP